MSPFLFIKAFSLNREAPTDLLIIFSDSASTLLRLSFDSASTLFEAASRLKNAPGDGVENYRQSRRKQNFLPKIGLNVVNVQRRQY